MGIGQALITEIVNRILSVTRPQRIILFGSAAATDRMTKGSDIDLLVLGKSPLRESNMCGFVMPSVVEASGRA